MAVTLRRSSSTAVFAVQYIMVSRLGFEPRTLGLKVRCSDQTELPAHLKRSPQARRDGKKVMIDRLPAGRDRPITDISYHFASPARHLGHDHGPSGGSGRKQNCFNLVAGFD